MTTEHARKIAEAIRDDICNRRGLRQEWENIERDVQEDILESWTVIIIATEDKEAGK